MKKADCWREVKWECPHCEAHNELDASATATIHKRIEKCMECGKESELNDRTTVLTGLLRPKGKTMDKPQNSAALTGTVQPLVRFKCLVFGHQWRWMLPKDGRLSLNGPPPDYAECERCKRTYGEIKKPNDNHEAEQINQRTTA